MLGAFAAILRWDVVMVAADVVAQTLPCLVWTWGYAAMSRWVAVMLVVAVIQDQLQI